MKGGFGQTLIIPSPVSKLGQWVGLKPQMVLCRGKISLDYNMRGAGIRSGLKGDWNK